MIARKRSPIWNTRTDGASMIKQPEITVYAGPNGSGKSTIICYGKISGDYINADEIKRTTFCSELEAAQLAEKLREERLTLKQDFTFETVLSTPRNLILLQRAHEAGYFIRCYYIVLSDPAININRVKARVAEGGHDVPEDKIIERYGRALKLIPEVVKVCDIMHIYDNTDHYYRIFRKHKSQPFLFWKNEFWPYHRIETLTGVTRTE